METGSKAQKHSRTRNPDENQEGDYAFTHLDKLQQLKGPEDRLKLLPGGHLMNDSDGDVDEGDNDDMTQESDDELDSQNKSVHEVVVDPIYLDQSIFTIVSNILKLATPAIISAVLSQVPYVFNMVLAGK